MVGVDVRKCNREVNKKEVKVIDAPETELVLRKRFCLTKDKYASPTTDTYFNSRGHVRGKYSKAAALVSEQPC